MYSDMKELRGHSLPWPPTPVEHRVTDIGRARLARRSASDLVIKNRRDASLVCLEKVEMAEVCVGKLTLALTLAVAHALTFTLTFAHFH